MADLAKVKRNIQRMIDGGASEAEIDEYVASEGTSPDELRGGKPEATVAGADDEMVKEALSSSPALHDSVQPSASQPNPPKNSAGTSAMYGFGHGATFGLLDEAGAVMDGIFGDYAGDGERTSIWEGLSQGKGIGDVYRENRDKNRAVLAQAQQEHPNAYLAGDLASVAVPGLGWVGAAGKAGKAMSTGQRAMQGAKVGAAAGAARGYGDGEGFIDSTLGALKGGAIGAPLGAAVGVASKGLDKIGEAGTWATDKIVKGYDALGEFADAGINKIIGKNPITGMIGDAFEQKLASHPISGPVVREMGGTQAMLGRAATTKATGGINLGVEGAARAAKYGGHGAGRMARDPRAVMAAQNAVANQELQRKDKVSTSLQDPQAVIAAAKGTKFEPVLMNAQAGGRQKFLAILHVLRTNPEFRSMVESKMQR